MNLYIIGGTMGVGKSTVCSILKEQLMQCVLLEGDWCWDANPFIVNEDTKSMVVDNICYVINNFLQCVHYNNIVFSWVLHQQFIIDDILCRLDLTDCSVKCFSLMCNEQALRTRLDGDIARGLRKADIVERSISRLPYYDSLNTIKIDTVDKTPAQIAQAIIQSPFNKERI